MMYSVAIHDGISWSSMSGMKGKGEICFTCLLTFIQASESMGRQTHLIAIAANHSAAGLAHVEEDWLSSESEFCVRGQY